jgi:hypothetical protein
MLRRIAIIKAAQQVGTEAENKQTLSILPKQQVATKRLANYVTRVRAIGSANHDVVAVTPTIGSMYRLWLFVFEQYLTKS